MSSSSDSSGPSSESGNSRSPAYLARRILKKLQAAPLDQTMAVADHQKATEAMLRLREHMTAGNAVGRDVASCLTCAGVAVRRRALIGPEQLDAAESLQTTMALLFVLVVLATSDGQPTGHDGGAADDDADTVINLKTWESGSLCEALRSADVDADTSSWARVLREPGGLCQSVLRLTRRNANTLGVRELASHGSLFFRASAAAMAVALLDNAAPVVDGNDFLTLDAMAIAREVGYLREERLLGIADCAESEAGQTVRAFHFEPCSPLRTTAYLPPGAHPRLA